MELLESCLRRIEAVNPAVNAMVALDADRARALVASLPDGRLDDEAAVRLLECYGIEVTTFRRVRGAEAAVAAAEEIGLPVVVKPQDGNQGKGVTVNVTTRDGMAAAYKAADEIGQVMVEKFLPGGDYRLLVGSGPDDAPEERVVDDPYRWLPTLGTLDMHLIGEGRHERLWDALGAHVRHYDTASGPVTGTSFAVWAPNARGVRVTGDVDGWAGWALPMRSLGTSGIWEIFLPDVGVGARVTSRV